MVCTKSVAGTVVTAGTYDTFTKSPVYFNKFLFRAKTMPQKGNPYFILPYFNKTQRVAELGGDLQENTSVNHYFSTISARKAWEIKEYNHS